MTTLVVADVHNGQFAFDAVARTVAAVRKLGELHVLLLGSESEEAAAKASCLEGVARILVATDPAYSHGLPEATCDLVVSLAAAYSHICGPTTSFCKSLLPRVAALLDVMIIPDVTAVVDASTFVRPIYAGSALQTVASIDVTKVFTIRPAGFVPVQAVGEARVEAVFGPTGNGASTWLEDIAVKSDRPELTAAKIVVSGGRGVGSESNFALINSLADKLGAAVGASRAAVDSGFAPNDLQVGQTGKIVAPDLYIAVGISGAIQHLAGMKESKVIVAINCDEDAPIFSFADFGLVANLFEAVPEFASKL